MQISPELVKKLREMTGAGMMSCKEALSKTAGDIKKAVEYLRKKGIASASKKAERKALEGVIGSYVHGNRIGVLVEVNCETDFVARTKEFQNFVKDIAMHIAAMNPLYIKAADVLEEDRQRHFEMYKEQALNEGKTEEVAEKIAKGRFEKYLKECCLYSQSFIKDETKTIEDFIKEHIAFLGENIFVRRFVRYELGQET